ncbi:hypothetical protein BV22DRAFT_1033513 [Leucogyrophana mollusca]|uniref:Uncharacterized protein n=1 Tax=Leucogyrophana mollusca TaxID=85980 RepID=A0ACB8BJ74_9AGAM|nr:hypothetical protein BV22DRAFT_1033513 [Leucogyrophana mollusca]
MSNIPLPPASELTVNVSAFIGPVELGVVVAIFLFGCSVVQGYIYYSTFRRDPWFFKVLVAVVLALEAAHVSSTVACMWSMTVTTYGNPLALAVFPVGADLAIVFTSLISWVVQGFFIYRLTKFSKTKTFPLLCVVICVLTHTTGLVVAGEAFAMTSLTLFESAQFRLITMSLTAQAVCDLTITVGMVYHLRNRRKSGFPQTVFAIDRLILWTLETGLITGLTSILVTIFFLTMRRNFVWVGIYAYFACIYANSLLASLNSRLNVLSKKSDGPFELNNRSNPSGGFSRTNPVVINISQTVEHNLNDKADAQPEDRFVSEAGKIEV